MDIERAKELLSALADGVDPLTGEVLDRDNVCNRPEIIRALHMALYELDKREKKTVKKHLPENAGKPWTEEDEDRLCEMFRLRCVKAGALRIFQAHGRRNSGAACETRENKRAEGI